MDTNGNATPAQARAQPSIRSFFQPPTPSYTPPAPPANLYTSNPTSPLPKPTSQSPPLASLPQAPRPKAKLHPNATIAPVEEGHIQPLRRINSLLLPIHYPDSFYHNILKTAPIPSFSRIIQWTDPGSNEPKVIGGIICRLDPTPTEDFNPQAPTFVPGCYDIYIQSLALLSPYRNQGLAAAALDDVVTAAIAVSVAPDGVRIQELYAHVWTENGEALEWYQKRGFRRDQYSITGYYRRLKPDGAWILRRRIAPSDHLTSFQSQQTSAMATPLSNTPSPSPSLRGPPQLMSDENRPTRPSTMGPTRSFQDKGPEREWNDLPEDVLGNPLLKPASAQGSAEASRASSRSSSRSGTAGKKKRVYPPAAFGS
ncbi:hypothetical protein BGZ60DRAFT_418866 [Tricladium varicosporioides]|nr:hypothetical protein BGZ60DRAFT_418866 [Hymenoscyphus varicosporioides]